MKRTLEYREEPNFQLTIQISTTRQTDNQEKFSKGNKRISENSPQ